MFNKRKNTAVDKVIRGYKSSCSKAESKWKKATETKSSPSAKGSATVKVSPTIHRGRGLYAMKRMSFPHFEGAAGDAFKSIEHTWAQAIHAAYPECGTDFDSYTSDQLV